VSESKPITLITGARKGIGRYLAQHYLQQGHRVIGCSRRASDLDMPGYTHYQADVSDEQGVLTLFRQLKTEHQGIDNLINNAGIASMNHVLLTPMPTAQAILQTNVSGTLLFSREAAKLMRARGQGRIVNFTTVARPLHLEGEAVYAASKAAVESLTAIMARELAPFRITVNAIGPTPIDTDLTRAIPSHKLDQLVQRQAIKRLGRFEDVANVIDFFLSARSDFITGQRLFLGGV
jgi:3-oxoacyl-[acyl-carrier protein] reductase